MKDIGAELELLCLARGVEGGGHGVDVLVMLSIVTAPATNIITAVRTKLIVIIKQARKTQSK